MIKIINKYKELNPKNPYNPIVIGFCEICGTEARKTQYGADEDCPKCQDWFDWNNGNWMD